VASAGHRLHLVGHLQQAPAAQQRLLARIGEAHPPRRAVQQPGAQPALQAGHVAAHHGARHVQVLGSARQTAAVGHLDEDAHRGQAVHGIRSIESTMCRMPGSLSAPIRSLE